MANHCYNFANVYGSKDALDLLEKRIKDAKKENDHLWYETFYQVLGFASPEESTDSYEEFGSKWFNCDVIRDKDTEMTISGDSAWSPVSEFYRKISEVYNLEIFSTFEECGNDFGGWYDCKNGEVTKDVTMTYGQYRYTEDPYEYTESLLEDIENGDIEEVDEQLLNIMTDEHKKLFTT